MKLAIVAGEASGDLHASEVVAELRRLDPKLETFGIGGDLLQREGMRILHHAREMGVVGFFNVLLHLRMFRRIFREFIGALEREKPDALLLVDYPGFNLRVAERAKQMGLRVIYYISAPCPLGTTQYCSNLRTNPFGLTQTGLTCGDGFRLSMTCGDACPTLQINGYRNFTITNP